MKFVFSLLLISIAFLSCETGLIHQNPEPERLVVNAVFTADSTFELKLGRTFPFFETPAGNEISAAEVRIFENGRELGICTEVETGTYVLPQLYRVSSSENYEIEIRWRDFAPVTAGCNIPAFPNLTQVDTLSASENFILNIDLEDPVGDNFYLIQARVYGMKYGIASGQISDSIYINQPLPFNTNRDDARFISLLSFGGLKESFALFDDRLFNGGSQRLTLSFLKDSLRVSADFRPDSITYTISTLTADYYEYLVSVQENSVFIGSSLGNSANLHTNILNGLGILGGKAQRSSGIRIRSR